MERRLRRRAHASGEKPARIRLLATSCQENEFWPQMTGNNPRSAS
jgi:hypothetical protein